MGLKVRKLFLCFGAAALLISNALFAFGMRATAASEGRYSGYGEGISTFATTISSETVYFTDYNIAKTEIVNGVPAYLPANDLTNGCGAVAGAAIVGYYDKFYEDLIPDYRTYLPSSGRYLSNDSVHIPKVMWEMYSLMRTNVDDVGVSESDCLNGLKAYVNLKGHNLTYDNVKKNGKLDEATLLNCFSNNIPVIMFCNRIDQYAMSFSPNEATIRCSNYTTSGHIIVALGMHIIDYYNGNVKFRTDKYVKAVTGMNNLKENYFKLEENWCNSAYSVTIN